MTWHFLIVNSWLYYLSINRGLAYLTGHCGKWINLHVHRKIIHPPRFSDAIEHKGFIYAVSSFYGWTYCWPTLVLREVNSSSVKAGACMSSFK